MRYVVVANKRRYLSIYLAYLRQYASYWLDLGVDSNILEARDLRKIIFNHLTLMVDLDFQGQTNFFSNLYNFQGQSS